MLKTLNYPSHPLFYDSDFKNLEIESLFRTEEEAIFSMYEQLFDTREYICEETILKAMKYLIFKKGMSNQMDEIRDMTIEDVCIEHKHQVEKVKSKLHEMKRKLQELAY